MINDIDNIMKRYIKRNSRVFIQYIFLYTIHDKKIIFLNILLFILNLKDLHITLRFHLVLHPHGIVPTFFKLDLWSPGAGFNHIISTKGINQIKKGKL